MTTLGRQPPHPTTEEEAAQPRDNLTAPTIPRSRAALAGGQADRSAGRGRRILQGGARTWPRTTGRNQHLPRSGATTPRTPAVAGDLGTLAPADRGGGHWRSSLRMLGSSREGRCGRAQLLQRLADAVGEEAQVREAVGVALDADVELAGIGQHGHTQGTLPATCTTGNASTRRAPSTYRACWGPGTLVTNRSTIRWWRL